MTQRGSETCLLNPDHLDRFDMEKLTQLAVWLDGMKRGSGGSLEPLGTCVIDSLWKAIRTLNGNLHDKRFNPQGVLDEECQSPSEGK